ncbi:uncharacterized protein LOC121854322 isoform X1 [Homarus americanus]|uniref:uncharacterized protein LOC121854322 isoform X1 n=1 Tax=Homarus americanus TaxID=6706 RepID=UPI001C47671C|nr:uncharacterized protein LOC121854322 isoform X1 [Homarus americanus]
MGVGSCVWMFGVVVLLAANGGDGHGRLMEPVGRSSAWRKGFNTPINWEDDELNCGGFGVSKLTDGSQWDQNDGKCGVCGDNWADPQPRDNEAGGKYGKGIIVANYNMNQKLPIEVELTTSHWGHFEFHLCVNNDPTHIVEQECLDKHILELADGSGTNYPINYIFDPVNLTIPVILPKGVSCTQCVLQWHYRCGNSWGDCGNGTEGMGCGPQEWFRGCADISIS